MNGVDFSGHTTACLCASAALVALVAIASPAIAQDQNRPVPSEAPPAQSDPQPVSAQDPNGAQQPEASPHPVEAQPTPNLPVPSPGTSTPAFQSIDALAMRGWERPIPKAADTMLADKDGIRSALADLGIGFTGYTVWAYQYNMLQNDHGYHGRQLYNGQRLTRSIGGVSAFITYDLGRIGLDNGQFILTPFYSGNSLHAVDGPATVRIARLAYYQSFWNKKVEMKVGYFDNGFEYLGTQTAGSLAGGTLGPQASVPNEVGLSYQGFSSPAINIRINFKNHFYTKFGFQRSLPPGGATMEEKYNPAGLRFHVPGTGLLMIDEIGWDRPAASGQMATWVRAGGIYNTTNFSRFDGGVANHNWATFVAVDRQIMQVDGTTPNRGLYVGGTVNYAPPQQNFVSQYYEGRIYGVGLIKNRPFDLASIIATANVYSKDGLVARTAPANKNYKASFSVIGSYAYRLMPGLYLQPGLGVVAHPIYSPRFPAALNGYLTVSMFL